MRVESQPGIATQIDDYRTFFARRRAWGQWVALLTLFIGGPIAPIWAQPLKIATIFELPGISAPALAIAIDSSNTMFYAFNGTVGRVTPEGGVTIATFPSNSYFSGIAVAASGDVFLTDYYNHTVNKVAVDGTISTVAGQFGIPGSADGSGANALFAGPAGVVIDNSSGSVFVADSHNSAIRKISPNGEVTTFVGSNFVSSPFALTMDSSGNLYSGNNPDNTIKKIDPNGRITVIGSLNDMDDDGQGSLIASIALDGAGNIYAMDDQELLIKKLTSDGIATTVGGRLHQFAAIDGVGRGAAIDGVVTMVTGSSGNVFFGDSTGTSITIREGTPYFGPPVIAVQPTDASVLATYSTSVSVVADGTDTLAYTWRKDGTNLIDQGAFSGSLTPLLVLTNVSTDLSGIYDVVISNSYGSVTSSVATVVVNPILPGTVVEWGRGIVGNANVPSGLSGVVAISAGDACTLALLTDGTVAAWGDNPYGPQNVPYGLNGVTAITTGGIHSVALRSDGTVVIWGALESAGYPPDGLSGVVAVAAGGAHTLALKLDGTVVAWGGDTYGQIDVPAGLKGVVAIAAGVWHSVALKYGGTVVAWGGSYQGVSSGVADVPVGLNGVVAIAAGDYHTLALRADGTITAWGDNLNGQIDVPAGLGEVVEIAAGSNFSMALKKDGTVVVWGNNSDGHLSPPGGPTRFSAIAAGDDFAVALIAPPPPNIEHSRDGKYVTLLWPGSSAKGFQIESTRSLVPPVVWSPVFGKTMTNGGNWSLHLDAVGAQKFYRLKRPY